MRPVSSTYPVTCDYGVTGTWQAGYHTGRDYGCPIGTPVRATRAGRVVGIGEPWGSGYGTAVVVESTGPGGATVRHGYCHLSSTAVSGGASVAEGQPLGLSGDTGRTFGPHLHYEERFAPYLYDNVDRSPRFDLLAATVAQHPKAR